MGVLECTLVRNRFVKACMHVCVMFDENSFTVSACSIKLRVINASYLKKLHGW